MKTLELMQVQVAALKEERQELQKKIQTLDTFLTSEEFQENTPKTKCLIERQYALMKELSQVYLERIWNGMEIINGYANDFINRLCRSEADV